MPYKDSVERFDDFQCRKSSRKDDFRGQFHEVTRLASLGAKIWQFLKIIGAENRVKMAIVEAYFIAQLMDKN